MLKNPLRCALHYLHCRLRAVLTHHALVPFGSAMNVPFFNGTNVPFHGVLLGVCQIKTIPDIANIWDGFLRHL